MTLAVTYDDRAASHLLQRRLANIRGNVTQLRQMKLNENFSAECNNLTHDERTQLTVEWGHYTEEYILAVDDVRENYIIPSILQVVDVKKTFLRFFFILVACFAFLTFCLFSKRFFKVGKVQSGKHVNKKHFQNNSNEIAQY